MRRSPDSRSSPRTKVSCRDVRPYVAALAGDGQVGIIVPLAAQIESESGKWANLARPPIFAEASPYAGDGTKVGDAARKLKAEGATLLVLDCMGFAESHRSIALGASGLPVIVSNAIVVKVVSEVV